MAHKFKLTPKDSNRQPIIDHYVKITKKYGSIDRPVEIQEMTKDEYQRYADALSEHYNSGVNTRIVCNPQIPVQLQKDFIQLETLCEKATNKGGSYHTPITSQERASILASDADGWAAYGIALCHSDNPVENIEFEMKSMAVGSARSHGLTYFDSSIAPSIAEAEKEAAKYRYRSDVVVELIDGYQELINAYKKSWDYFWAYLHRKDPNYTHHIKPFTHRIKEHKKRIRQLKKFLKK